mmetsp:Transcript_53015/g.154420  ORF Transcript_53015/g.154420 Transcript_53015/m.154420 type:complete len:226 (-) Transcript_53015:104-781(-)
MKFYSPFLVLMLATMSDAYTCGGGFPCGPPTDFAFPSMMRNMSPRQRAAYRRKQAEFVNRAFDALTSDLQRSKVDPNFIPKQKELVDKTVEFFTDLGNINREDANNFRDITNKGFEIAQDLVTGSYSPAYEMEDGESEIEISMDLPGVFREDIDITLEDGILKVSGFRKLTKKDVIKSVPFTRDFSIDETVDIEKISANLDSGVLQIRIPKKPLEKPPVKRINIQ